MRFVYVFADGTRKTGPDITTGDTGWHDLPEKKISQVAFQCRGIEHSIVGCEAYCIGVVTGEGAVFGGSRILAVHLFGLTQKGVRLIEIGPFGNRETLLPAEKASNIGPWRKGG